MEVNITDNSAQVLTEEQRKKKLALKAIGTQIERHAKEECPVDTGRLRNSINYVVRGNAIYVGTNVEYAPYVEYNDSVSHEKDFKGKKVQSGNAHFLEHSVTKHHDEYKKLARKIMS